jgi:hypothetical protein
MAQENLAGMTVKGLLVLCICMLGSMSLQTSALCSPLGLSLDNLAHIKQQLGSIATWIHCSRMRAKAAASNQGRHTVSVKI